MSFWSATYALLICVGVRDPKACMDWAFGLGWPVMTMGVSASYWNKRHGDLFVIRDTDEVIATMRKIGRAYAKEVQDGKDKNT